ncbi:MAG: phosphoribosylglycinamide formyltransferase [Vulcanimicrobiaceae bacterium]
MLVDLDERFSAESAESASRRLRDAGYTLYETGKPEERYLSWIDLAFAGTWSSEVARSAAIFATKSGESVPAAVAAYGAKGLRFYWLRGFAQRPDVGILGPIGVVPAHRGGGVLQDGLSRLALAALRKAGLRYALIPAVTEPILDALTSATGGRVVEKFSMDRIAPNIPTTVLASGAGTNFQAVIDALADGLGLELRALISSRADAFAIQRAQNAGISVIEHVWDRKNVPREAYDERLIELALGTGPELILMLGWMHLVSPGFIERFPHILNIHPAFLPHDDRAETVVMPDGLTIPAFRGAHAIRDAIAAKSAWYGATAHRVVVETDRGEVMQRAPRRLEESDEDRALATLRPTEHGVLLGAIRRFLAER